MSNNEESSGGLLSILGKSLLSFILGDKDTKPWNLPKWLRVSLRYVLTALEGFGIIPWLKKKLADPPEETAEDETLATTGTKATSNATAPEPDYTSANSASALKILKQSNRKK